MEVLGEVDLPAVVVRPVEAYTLPLRVSCILQVNIVCLVEYQSIFFFLSSQGHIQTVGVKRPGYGTGGRTVNTIVNAFTITIPDSIICHYDGQYMCILFIHVCSAQLLYVSNYQLVSCIIGRGHSTVNPISQWWIRRSCQRESTCTFLTGCRRWLRPVFLHAQLCMMAVKTHLPHISYRWVQTIPLRFLSRFYAMFDRC